MRERGYQHKTMGGWTLSVAADRATTLVTLSHGHVANAPYALEMPGDLLIDLEQMGYRPRIYHELNDAPPLVIWSREAKGHTIWVWEPRTNRFYAVAQKR